MRHIVTTLPSSLDRVPSTLLPRTRTRQLVRSSAIVATIAAASLGGCTHQLSSTSASPTDTEPRISDRRHPVPAVARQYIPDSLLLALGTVRRDSSATIKLVRGIVKVTFRDGTAQSARQQAIDSIAGVVVGGFRLDTDGEYFVRIPGSTYDDIQAAVRRLRALPQVEFAYPMVLSPAHLCCA